MIVSPQPLTVPGRTGVVPLLRNAVIDRLTPVCVEPAGSVCAQIAAGISRVSRGRARKRRLRRKFLGARGHLTPGDAFSISPPCSVAYGSRLSSRFARESAIESLWIFFGVFLGR